MWKKYIIQIYKYIVHANKNFGIQLSRIRRYMRGREEVPTTYQAPDRSSEFESAHAEVQETGVIIIVFTCIYVLNSISI